MRITKIVTVTPVRCKPSMPLTCTPIRLPSDAFFDAQSSVLLLQPSAPLVSERLRRSTSGYAPTKGRHPSGRLPELAEPTYPKVGIRWPNRSFSRLGRELVSLAEESSIASLHTVESNGTAE